MNVIMCIDSEKSRDRQNKKVIVNTFQKLFPISMVQLSEEIYNFVEIWEPEYLKISKQSATDAEEA